MFLYDQRHAYYAQQDYVPDVRHALMRYSGQSTMFDDLHEALTKPKLRFKTRLWGGWRSGARPDNSKPRRKDHR